MSLFSSALQERGVRWAPDPLFWAIHDDVQIEAPCDIAAEIHLFQRFRLGAFSHLNGGFIKDVSIGRYCSFARDVQIGHGFHPMDWLSVSPLQYSPGYRGWMQFVADRRGVLQPIEPVHFDWASHTTIGNDVWLGNHVVIKDGVSIGDGAVVGAHAVVTRDVPAYAVMAGNPARVIRMRFPEATVERLLGLQWWRYCLGDLGPLPFDRIDATLGLIEERVAAGLQAYEPPRVTGAELRAIAQLSGS
jgi:acetyltransferase-like isoleucine patch superfamily enzyme